MAERNPHHDDTPRDPKTGRPLQRTEPQPPDQTDERSGNHADVPDHARQTRGVTGDERDPSFTTERPEDAETTRPTQRPTVGDELYKDLDDEASQRFEQRTHSPTQHKSTQEDSEKGT